MATYMGEEALEKIFEILLNNFLRLGKLKLNGVVLTADEEKIIDIRPTSNDISYDNTESSLTSTNVQDAIDELKRLIDNMSSGGDTPSA